MDINLRCTINDQDPAQSERLMDAIRRYYEHRDQLTADNKESVEEVHKRFHDPEDTSPGIVKLRELQKEVDAATCEAHGWTDVAMDHDFYPEPDGSLHYRWSDKVRDDVLGRMVDVRIVDSAEEAAAHLKDKAAGKTKPEQDQSMSYKEAVRADVESLQHQLMAEIGSIRDALNASGDAYETTREQLAREHGEDLVLLASDEPQEDVQAVLERAALSVVEDHFPPFMSPEATREGSKRLAAGIAIFTLAPERFDAFLNHDLLKVSGVSVCLG